MVCHNAKKCLKKGGNRKRIFQFIRAMEARKVEFDNSLEDKQRFEAIMKNFKSEKAFFQHHGLLVDFYDENSVILSKEDLLQIERDMNVLHGDFREKGKAIPNNSINLILTDPLYGAKYLELWSALSELAQRVLVPSGFLISYSGELYLPKVFQSLGTHLEYYWTLALKLKSRNLITARNIFNLWKPLLIFYKPPLTLPFDYFVDFIEGKGGEKDKHPWQQAEAEIYSLIEYFCPQNGVVLDPMAGSGTTLAVTKKLQRQFMGIELEAENIVKNAERLKT